MKRMCLKWKRNWCK